MAHNAMHVVSHDYLLKREKYLGQGSIKRRFKLQRGQGSIKKKKVQNK